VHLVGFIIRIYHDARSSECQIIDDNTMQKTVSVISNKSI